MNADYIDDGDDYESDDYGDIIDAEVIEDTPELSPEVLAYLEENGGFNRGQLSALHDHMMTTNQSVTAFWNELSDTTKRAWKNLVDTFGVYYSEHVGIVSGFGMDVQNQIYVFIENYLRLKKLIEREISAIRARLRQPQGASQSSSTQQPRQSAQQSSSTPRSAATQPATRTRRIPTSESTSASFQSVAGGFSVAKLLPWVLVGGLAWYVYTNRRSLFA